jgi:hypothetical protein
LLKNIFIIVFAFTLCSTSFGQSTNYTQKLWLGNDSLQLDTFTLIYGSVQCTGFKENVDFKVNYLNGYIHWKLGNKPDTVWVSYRSLSVSFNSTYYRKNPQIEKIPYSEGQLGYVPTSKKANAPHESELATLGNLSRGIGFGNNQDVTINSNLNLRINGILGNDVEILAAISDENNPIQPEGNTQQLQDFDKVFIELKRAETKLALGDFLMKSQPNSYFLKFYKKSRGIQFNQQITKPFGKIETGGEVAVARGRFSRNVFDGLEGNRGPYRLKGTNGELFIIIIAGTESVYLDGELLERGEQNDYTIDYNSGELVFMPRIIITRYSRIVAEFQYSDRNYARSVVHQYNQFSKNNWGAHLNFYREGDNKNQPFQQSLDGYDSLNKLSARQILGLSGDAPLAYIPKVKRLNELRADKVMYVQIEDVLLGLYYQHAQSAEEDSVFYEVSFSYVGPNQGNYTQKQSGANGRVYQFIPPINVVLQGDYEPVEIIIPAKSLFATNAGLEYVFENIGKISAEAVWSHQDLNTFSKLDDKNNNGFGTKLNWQGKSKADTTGNWEWLHKASFEWVDKQFRSIERYRDVEFDRKWNRTLQNPDNDNARQYGQEIIGDVLIGANYKQKATISYNLGLYQMQEVKKGSQHQINVGCNTNKWRSQATAILANIGNDTSTNNYRLLNARISKPIKNWEPGVYFKNEQSLFSLNTVLVNGSYNYEQLGVFINRRRATETWGLNFDANSRKDQQIRNEKLDAFTLANTFSLNGQWTGKNSNRVGLTSIFRNLQFADDSLETENTLQLRLDASIYAFKKGLNWQSFWQVGTGQEQRREFSYLQVQPGNGVYVWNDYDSNGLQTLNEFETASELDRNRANYIRVFTPVQGFIQSVNTQINQTIRIEPANWMKKKQKSFVGRFSAISAFNNEQKQMGSLDASKLNPWNAIADSFLISTTNSLRHTVFFNKADPVFGLDYNYITHQNKLLLVNGFEWRTKKEQQVRLRWNIGKSLSLNADGKWGERGYNSAFFTNRNYAYKFEQLEPRVQYQYQSSWRLIVFGKWFQANNAPEWGTEKMKSQEVGLEGRWLQADKGVIAGTVAWVGIKYTGETNSSLSYDLLQGLLPGNNIKWNINADRRVAAKVQLSVNYDGRKSPANKVIHIGRVVARYLF